MNWSVREHALHCAICYWHLYNSSPESGATSILLLQMNCKIRCNAEKIGLPKRIGNHDCHDFCSLSTVVEQVSRDSPLINQKHLCSCAVHIQYSYSNIDSYFCLISFVAWSEQRVKLRNRCEWLHSGYQSAWTSETETIFVFRTLPSIVHT